MSEANNAAQMSFGEETLLDPGLLASLDRREAARENLQLAEERWGHADEEVKGLLEAKQLEPGVYRTGKYRITVKEEKRRRTTIEKASQS